MSQTGINPHPRGALNTLHTKAANRVAALCACLATAGMMSVAQAAPAPVTYNFGMNVGQTAVNGYFVIDGNSNNYVGGGTTTRADVLDYLFTFSKGAWSFTGSPSNVDFLGTFKMTYSLDLSAVTAWDFFMSFKDGLGDLYLGFTGNNIINGGFAQVVDYQRRYAFDDAQFPAPVLTAQLQSNTVPTPPILPLVGIGLAAMALPSWRRARRGV